MPRLARHLAGYEALPQEPPLLSLPERMLEQFMAAATDARALPSFVPLEQADASAQTLFAQSILSMADAAGAAGIGDVGAGGTVPSGQPLEPARDTTPPATEKTHAPTSATGGPLRTAPMPVQAPLPSEPAPAAPGRIATLPVGGLRAPVIAMSPSAPREVPTAPHTAAASAPKPTADDLRGVLRAVHNVPREHRREWLAQVHARRFASHYPDLVDLMLDVLAAQDSHR